MARSELRFPTRLLFFALMLCALNGSRYRPLTYCVSLFPVLITLLFCKNFLEQRNDPAAQIRQHAWDPRHRTKNNAERSSIVSSRPIQSAPFLPSGSWLTPGYRIGIPALARIRLELILSHSLFMQTCRCWGSSSGKISRTLAEPQNWHRGCPTKS